MAWDINRALRVAIEGAMSGLRAGAEHMLTEAIDNCPKDTGTLRRSGTVTEGARGDAGAIYQGALGGQKMNKAFPHKLGGELAVYVSFNTPYAENVHEGYEGFTIRARNKKVLAMPLKAYKKWLNSRGMGDSIRGVLNFLDDNRYTGKLPCLSGDGKYVIFGRAVRHPGYKGAKYLEKAFNANARKVLKLAESRMKRALREAR